MSRLSMITNSNQEYLVEMALVDFRKLYVTYPVFSIDVNKLHTVILTQFVIHVKPFLFIWEKFLFHLLFFERFGLRFFLKKPLGSPRDTLVANNLLGTPCDNNSVCLKTHGSDYVGILWHQIKNQIFNSIIPRSLSRGCSSVIKRWIYRSDTLQLVAGRFIRVKSCLQYNMGFSCFTGAIPAWQFHLFL